MIDPVRDMAFLLASESVVEALVVGAIAALLASPLPRIPVRVRRYLAFATSLMLFFLGVHFWPLFLNSAVDMLARGVLFAFGAGMGFGLLRYKPYRNDSKVSVPGWLPLVLNAFGLCVVGWYVVVAWAWYLG